MPTKRANSALQSPHGRGVGQGGHDRSGGLSHWNKCKGGRPRRRGGREVRGVGRAGGGCDTKEQERLYRHDAPPDYVPARRGSCQHSGALTSALLKQIHSVDIGSDTLRSSDERSSDTPAFIRREAISSSNTLTSASSEPPPLLHPLRALLENRVRAGKQEGEEEGNGGRSGEGRATCAGADGARSRPQRAHRPQARPGEGPSIDPHNTRALPLRAAIIVKPKLYAPLSKYVSCAQEEE
jgi:hypothetical protein